MVKGPNAFHRNPKLTTLRPSIDLDTGILTIAVHNSPSITPLHIPLAASSSNLADLHSSDSRVCGDEITALTYEFPEVVKFFTAVLGVSCTLARFPAESTSRNYKPYLANVASNNGRKEPKILLSNESPILIVNQSSVDKLNSEIERTGGKAASADVFRANIVLKDTGATKRPYAEDGWSCVKIGQEYFEVSQLDREAANQFC
jgi:molybdenum cofactor sulfurtransferase